jgi:hypothetical protein
MFMLPHYNQVLQEPFKQAGFDVVYEFAALQQPYAPGMWPLRFPKVEWTDNTVVIMHCQDFVSIVNGTCPELLAIEKHYGSRANQVVVVHWNIDLQSVYTGPMHLIYFPAHSYGLLNNLSQTQDEWKPNLLKKRIKNWQCLNGTTRRHRELVAYYMQEHFNNGVLSYGERIPLPEWSFDTYFGCENELNWMRLQPVYSDCTTNIVTETQYYETPGIVTEKTLMAFLGLQVPVFIGYRGMIDHIEGLGFDVFRDLVKTDYDHYQDDVRWQQAIDLNKDVINGKFNREDYLERMLRNQEYALNMWPELLVEQFSSNAQDILENLHQSS